MDSFRLKEGLILTFEQTDDLNVEDKKVKILPAARWILEGTGQLAF
ncbi:TPA: hypothetical protein HA231_01320 [Candidatus Woesearchaeota archaeon]|nr:hypothetical protein [Candidatus Woesearchaeota archaeon]